ncbi:hypothetical protein AA313_de0205495 [Arthrobotrys entomopaga]|nr:hypothetical protein AA313_de0205495 [Arthrobotrys entomopaga]
MATAYIPTAQIPLMGQPPTPYELQVDPITGQAYSGACVPAPGQQQIFITSGQPVQLLQGPGGQAFPQLRFQNPGPNGYMHTPPNLMHMPYAGDLHAPPAYTEMDPSRFQQQRSRRSSISMNFPGAFNTFTGPQMSHSMEFAYMDSCVLCRANHPGPHPHGMNMNMNMNMNMPDYPASMGGPRHISMDDNMSTSSKMRSAGYGYEGPMYDPMDWSHNRGRPRDPWEFNRPRPMPNRSRPRSQGPGNRSGRLGLPFDNNSSIRVSELQSDDDSDDDRGRSNSNNYPNNNNLRRSYSTNRARSTSRGPRPPPSTSTYM